MIRDGYKNVAIPRSIHTELKLASVHSDMAIMEFAVEAIKRYIPRMPKGLEHNLCATCDNLLMPYAQYCTHCGQRVKWE